MRKFEVGKTYSMRSICNQDCVWTYKVIARTACTVTLDDGKEVKRCRISKGHSEIHGAETVLPRGSYSMCPTLTA